MASEYDDIGMIPRVCMAVEWSAVDTATNSAAEYRRRWRGGGGELDGSIIVLATKIEDESLVVMAPQVLVLSTPNDELILQFALLMPQGL
jgi:hypothetical protein